MIAPGARRLFPYRPPIDSVGATHRALTTLSPLVNEQAMAGIPLVPLGVITNVCERRRAGIQWTLAAGALHYALLAQAQLEHRHWHFGFGAGLDMGTATPTALSNGALSTDEGVASIADANGQLLFYANGERIWDRSHAVMPNGGSLQGHYSSQSVLIVPFPEDAQRYYVFTTPAMAGTYGGPDNLAYSVVDMTARDGLGDVMVLNQPLAGPVVEKLTATRHANGREVWVLAHGWEKTIPIALIW